MSEQPATPPDRSLSRILGPLIAIAITCALIALLAYGLVASAPNTAIQDALGRGQAPVAPPFRLRVEERGALGPILDARLKAVFARHDVSLSELRGTPVILNLWASWCVPCQLEAPTLERAWKRLARPAGVLFLGLDQQDSQQGASTFLHHYRIDYPNLNEGGNDTSVSYGATGVPETFAITASGRIVAHIIGESSPSQLADAIAAARSGRIHSTIHGGQERAAR